MELWTRNILYWDLRGGTSGIKTTLPVMDSQGNIEEGKTQRLSSLRAVSLPKRRGKIEVGIHPSVDFMRHAGEEHILGRFTKLLEDDRNVAVSPGTRGERICWPPLIFNFNLQDEESFCDVAINLAESILKKAGVEDKDNYFLGHFTLEIAPFEKIETSWCSLMHGLRVRHHLPLTYPGDDRAIPLVEPRDLL